MDRYPPKIERVAQPPEPAPLKFGLNGVALNTPFTPEARLPISGTKVRFVTKSQETYTGTVGILSYPRANVAWEETVFIGSSILDNRRLLFFAKDVGSWMEIE